MTGQFLFVLGLGILLYYKPDVAGQILSHSLPVQTAIVLLVAQIGCTFGTVWGMWD